MMLDRIGKFIVGVNVEVDEAGIMREVNFLLTALNKRFR